MDPIINQNGPNEAICHNLFSVLWQEIIARMYVQNCMKKDCTVQEHTQNGLQISKKNGTQKTALSSNLVTIIVSEAIFLLISYSPHSSESKKSHNQTHSLISRTGYIVSILSLKCLLFILFYCWQAFIEIDHVFLLYFEIRKNMSFSRFIKVSVIFKMFHHNINKYK